MEKNGTGPRLKVIGAGKIPDKVKQELLPLSKYVRMELIHLLKSVILFLQTGKGSKEDIVKSCTTLLKLITLGDRNARGISQKGNTN